MPNGTTPGPPLTGTMVDTFTKLVVQVGFPVVVAGVLLWFLLTKFQDTMHQITVRMEKTAEVAQALVEQEEITGEQMKALVALQKDEVDTLKRIEAAPARQGGLP
jgi:hypothetical protein